MALTIFTIILGLAALAAGTYLWTRRHRLAGAVYLLLGAGALIYMAIDFLMGVDLPQVTVNLPMTLISSAIAFGFIVGGWLLGIKGYIAAGVPALFLLIFLVFDPNPWFYWGFVAVALAAALVYYRWKIPAVALLSAATTAAAPVVVVMTSPVVNKVKQTYEAIKLQLENNNKKFPSYEEMCLAAEPGSNIALICEQMNKNSADIAELQFQVSANTTAIQTLAGQVAMVTEKPAEDNASQQIIQSNPSNDDAAAAALAEELVKAGWKAGEFSVNDIDRSIRTDVGAYPFGDRIDGIKARLVEVLNGSEPWQAAIRDRVLSAVPEGEHARLLSGDGYYAIQFKRPVCLGGSDFWKDGRAYAGDGGKVCYDAGDVSWAFVGSDGTVYWGASVRDACNNSHYDTAPAPQDVEQAELCPEGTERAGQMIGSGCGIPERPTTPNEETPQGSTPPGSTPPGSTPPGSTTPSSPPSSTTPPTTPPTTEPPTTTPTTPDDAKSSPPVHNTWVTSTMGAPTGAPEVTEHPNIDPAQPGTTAATTAQAPDAGPRPSPTPGQDPAPSVDPSPSVDNTGDVEPGSGN